MNSFFLQLRELSRSTYCINLLSSISLRGAPVTAIVIVSQAAKRNSANIWKQVLCLEYYTELSNCLCHHVITSNSKSRYTHTHTHTHTYIYIYIYIYIFTHTYIYIYFEISLFFQKKWGGGTFEAYFCSLTLEVKSIDKVHTLVRTCMLINFSKKNPYVAIPN